MSPQTNPPRPSRCSASRMLQKEARWGQPGQKVCSRRGARPANVPELFSIGRRKRRRFDSQNPADGRGHQVGIQLARHRQRPVVFPVKGLDPDLPRLLGGQDLDLLLEKREDLLDDQDLFVRVRCSFQKRRRDGPGRPELENAHPVFGREQRDGLPAVEAAGAARDDQEFRLFRSGIGVEGALLEERRRLPDLLLLETVLLDRRGR